MVSKIIAIFLILYCIKHIYDLLTINTLHLESDIREKFKYEHIAKKAAKCYKILYILEYTTYISLSILALRNNIFFISILITFFAFVGLKILASKIFETISKKVSESN